MVDIMTINSKLMLAAQMRMLAIEMNGIADDIDQMLHDPGWTDLAAHLDMWAVKVQDRAIGLEAEEQP